MSACANVTGSNKTSITEQTHFMRACMEQLFQFLLQLLMDTSVWLMRMGEDKENCPSTKHFCHQMTLQRVTTELLASVSASAAAPGSLPTATSSSDLCGTTKRFKSFPADQTDWQYVHQCIATIA